MGVGYSNDPVATPGVTYTYDRLGRRKTVLRSGTTTTYEYAGSGQLLSEWHSGGLLSGMQVTNTYNSLSQRRSVTASRWSTGFSYFPQSFVTNLFTYDGASRVASVSDGSFSGDYTYLANSMLIGQVTFKQGATMRMTTSRKYDRLNRLREISSTPTGANQMPFHYAYEYNGANQRVRTTLGDGSFWVYSYDSLGQATSGKKYFEDGTPVPGQQFEYAFDTIGNRTSTKAGGDQNGGNLRPASYGVSALNQYTSRTIPSSFDVVGIADAGSTVSINGSGTGVYRRGQYFQKALTVSNGGGPVWQSVSA